MIVQQTRCHRCGETMTLHVAGSDYCEPCRREIRARQEADARRPSPRFRAKDMTGGTAA